MQSTPQFEDSLGPLLRALALDGLELTEKYERRELSAEEYAAAFGVIVNQMALVQNVPRNVGVMRGLLEQMDESDRSSVLASEQRLIPPSS